MWLVANCNSILSLESLNSVAMIPALLLKERGKRERKQNFSMIGYWDKRKRTASNAIAWVFAVSYTSIFRGRPQVLNSKANFLTDSMELRSSSITSNFALELSLIIASLICLAALTSLIPITTWTPRNASTRAVSAPMPLVAPAQTYLMKMSHLYQMLNK